MEKNLTKIEAYYQALTFRRMAKRFMDYAETHDSVKAYNEALFYLKMYKQSCVLAGI